MQTISVVDHDGPRCPKAILRYTRLPMPRIQRRQDIVSTVQARKTNKRSREEKRAQRAIPDRTALETRERTAGSRDSSVLGMESGIDVAVQIIDSESDDDMMTEVGRNGTTEESVLFETVAQSFPYELDKFQSVAIKELLTGRSVVVCAPTGAGKTAIADGATFACLSKGKSVIYTTPLKALSNQKLFEFRQRFGEDQVGLVTGDVNFQPFAPVIVMTTEILRNMVYDVSFDPGMGRKLNEVGLVVLDEVHYLGDPSRGSVWEELIVGCPKHIQMLCMSATVANPQDLGDWISQIHGPCSTVRTGKRPVPLSWFFAFSVPDSNRTAIYPLFNAEKTDANPACLYEEKNGFGDNKPRKINPLRRIPELYRLILEMETKKFLPVIFFIFSRADCDAQAEKMCDFGVSLTTAKEQAIIRQALQDVKDDQPEAIKSNCEDALIAGIATHHAGCLPAWKQLVESLFQDGHLKVVFATGTLAAGINMPARTTVISKLSKRIDGNFALMGHNELLQMAGRAGRRGFDTEGNCVILQSQFEGAAEAITILKKGTEPLTSQFTTGYSFVLNLLAKFTLKEAKEFLEKSFRNYLTGIGLIRRIEEIKSLKKKVKELRAKVMEELPDDANDSEGQALAEVTESLGKAQNALRKTIESGREERTALVVENLNRLSFPFPALIDVTKNTLGTQALPAIALAEKIESEGKKSGTVSSEKRIYCLAADNVFYKVTCRCIVGAVFQNIRNSEALRATTQRVLSPRKRWKDAGPSHVQSFPGNKSTAKVAFRIPPVAEFERFTWSHATQMTIVEQTDALRELKKAWRAGSKIQNKEKSYSPSKLEQKLLRAEKQVRLATNIKKELESQKRQGWKGFKATMDILIMLGAVENKTLKILPLGHVTRELFGENELWMAIVFTHPSVQLLKPSLLAALSSTFIAPNICARPSLNFAVEPTEEIEELLLGLEESRRQLYEYEVTSGVVNTQSLSGLQMDSRATGLVELWAAGGTWDQVAASTNMDDGDIALLLSRTLDVLRQIYLSKYLLDPLRNAARSAHRSMNRKPICYESV